MRFAMIAAAFGAACLAMPAQADPHLYEMNIYGHVFGFQNVFVPDQQGCDGNPSNEYCNTIGPFDAYVGTTFSIFADDPTGPFDVGSGRVEGEFTGTILGSVEYGFTGINLSYIRDQAGCCFIQAGTAPTFNVTLLSIDGQPAPPPIPEPATWAMMVMGFGAMGAAMRRRVRVRYA